MRPEIEDVLRQFQTGELPSDAQYFRLHGKEVELIVASLATQTERDVSWEAPVDLFNFYHLQLAVDPSLHSPLYGKSQELLRRLIDEGRSASFLHLLLSTFSRWMFAYWQRFSRDNGAIEETISLQHDPHNHGEKEMLKAVQQSLVTHGWQLLTPEEANEPVLGASPVWPQTDGPALVRHMLFPGCGSLLD